MCRNIKTLFNFDPPATEVEIREASLQFVRKISGMNRPSVLNSTVFDQAVDEVAESTKTLLKSLTTNSMQRNRQFEAQKARDKVRKRIRFYS